MNATLYCRGSGIRTHAPASYTDLVVFKTTLLDHLSTPLFVRNDGLEPTPSDWKSDVQPKTLISHWANSGIWTHDLNVGNVTHYPCAILALVEKVGLEPTTIPPTGLLYLMVVNDDPQILHVIILIQFIDDPLSYFSLLWNW